MEILEQVANRRAETTAPAVDDNRGPMTAIRFQKGVDFETFDDFRGLYLSILKSGSLPEGERQIEKMVEADTPARVNSLPKFGGLEVTVPDAALDSVELRRRIRESERVMAAMGESRLDPELLTTTMLQIGWPGGTVSLTCVGVPKIGKEAEAEVRNAMQRFLSDSQMMLVWFAGILGSQGAMRGHLDDLAERGEPLTINTYRPDGRVDAILARVQVDSVVDAFGEAGEFERLYAKAFVVFTYQIWEEVTRPAIAKALQVDDPNHIKADLMGDWRHLRNWLVHRTKKTENGFFDKARMLSAALDLQRGDPGVTANDVAILMQHLNHMQIEVNPRSLEFGFESVPVDASMVAGMAGTVKAGSHVALPEALMYPSGVVVVFNDGPTATIHERDCSHADHDFRGLDGGRTLSLTSRELARGALEHLGKEERRCPFCG